VSAFEWDAGDSAGIIINLTMWSSVEDLAAFAYSGEDRVRHLRAHGPTPYAFTLKQTFAPGSEAPWRDGPIGSAPRDRARQCP
jgi:hypothetical protein